MAKIVKNCKCNFGYAECGIIEGIKTIEILNSKGQIVLNSRPLLDLEDSDDFTLICLRCGTQTWYE